MKTSELMLGDIINIDGVPRKICSLTKHKVGYHKDHDNTRLYYARVHQCEPIPLTPEILEKNGFKYGYTSNEEDILISGVGVPIDIPKGWVLDEGDGSVKIIFPNEYDGGLLSISDQCYNRDMQFVWADILYVHELLHALRLCGLID